MFVIEVIPLKRGIQVDSLSYFSSQEYTRGTMLTIPLRNDEVLGMVTDVQEVSATKTALRAATFSLRRLPQQKEVQVLSSACIKTAEELARQYACHPGTVLYSLLPPEIRNGEMTLPHTHHVEHEERHVPEVLQGAKSERYLAYRSLVRETFAHSGSIVCVVPSSAEVDEAYRLLSSGIEDRIVLFSSARTKKQLRDSYALLADFSRPKLIITTPTHALFERHDITMVILEHARSPYFKERTRPYLDARDVLMTHARFTGRRVILGDLLPRSEEEQRRRMEVYQTFGETPRRLELPGKLEIITMKDKPDGGTPFKLFSKKVIDAIVETKRAKGHTFLFAARRGLAPVVACTDCGFIFRSKDSGAPYSLVRTVKNGVEERWFICSTSGHRERAADTCPECGSWRLRERGIGIQYVHDELSKILDGSPIILFDHTTAGTFKKASFLRDKFLETKGSIMLGTQMAIPYLSKPVDTSVIVSMDALYATPTWRLEEENLAFLLRLREETSGTLYVQTRIQNDDLIQRAKQGAVEQFYTEEIELRKTFNYPPFTTFIHLTWQGTKDAVAKLEASIKSTLAGYNASFYAAPPSPKGVYISYALIRIATKDWPEEKLSARLRSLSPSVRIVINPDRIV